ncbi:D-Ala-D-Ala carboxypeptidase family metallohydrolase [Anaerofustis stercorihominis]|uniref:D-Ala-D-Ala carboxypeptidase family metallohydrolase n=1 Tax=Anaerofustis stercorihominis TaxID=214853 RepID=UPI0026715AC2|nr:D-Ala-D-Ala carboxypeptidase family metallohydrolase [Anaerofustis stercorihominis]
MNVKKYSKKKHGNKTVPGAPHFKIKEFACNDGSDAIYIDVDLAKKLEKIRVHFNKPAHINSGYRPPNYNLKVGGASNSYHTKGRAFDVYIAGINPKTVAAYAESIGIKGIGCYNRSIFVHIDSRPSKYFWTENSAGRISYGTSTFGGDVSKYPTLRKGSQGSYVKKLQQRLVKKGYKIKVDGKFGTETYNAVKKLQKKYKLVVDGIVGAKTWKVLYK